MAANPQSLDEPTKDSNCIEQRLSLKVRVVPYGHVQVLTQTCTQDLGHVHNYVLVSDCASHVTRCASQHYQSRDCRLLVTVSASCKDLEIRMRFISSRGLSSVPRGATHTWNTNFGVADTMFHVV